MQAANNEMTIEEKVRFVNGIRIMHPSFEEALDIIDETHKEGQLTQHPLSLLIYGPTGSGKTTILETYLNSKQKAQVIQSPDGKSNNMSILSVKIPSPATPVAVTEMLLKQLGDRYFTKGTASQKMQRLSELIKNKNVQLIMVDEIQHFVDRDLKKVVLRVSDWFKAFINEIGKPFVLFGLNTSLDVLDINPQISRRIPTRLEMKPFEQNEHFLTFLHDIDEQLMVVFEKQSHLTDPDVSEQIFYASDGSMSSIMLLIRRAAKLAIDKKRERVELIDFAEAFARYGHLNEQKTVNPFLIKDFSIKDYT